MIRKFSTSIAMLALAGLGMASMPAAAEKLKFQTRPRSGSESCS